MVEISKKEVRRVRRVIARNEWAFDRECLKKVGKLMTPGRRMSTLVNMAGKEIPQVICGSVAVSKRERA